MRCDCVVAPAAPNQRRSEREKKNWICKNEERTSDRSIEFYLFIYRFPFHWVSISAEECGSAIGLFMTLFCGCERVTIVWRNTRTISLVQKCLYIVRLNWGNDECIPMKFDSTFKYRLIAAIRFEPGCWFLHFEFCIGERDETASSK